MPSSSARQAAVAADWLVVMNTGSATDTYSIEPTDLIITAGATHLLPWHSTPYAGEVTIMLLDVLTGLDELKICTSYECDGSRRSTFPADSFALERCKPIYETMPPLAYNLVLPCLLRRNESQVPLPPRHRPLRLGFEVLLRRADWPH